MTPSSPSFSPDSHLQKGPARPVSMIGTIALAIVLILALFFLGREVLLNGHVLFEGGR